MDVVIAGGHGQIALRLARLLSARGERVRSLIRNPDHAADVSQIGAEAGVFDLEAGSSSELADAVAGADAAVFAAGAGPGSGPERKRTVDLGGAVKLIEAAQASRVRRYVIVSSIGADEPSAASEAMRPYLEAKAEADAAVVASGLDWTIVRPGHLTDGPGTTRGAGGDRGRGARLRGPPARRRRRRDRGGARRAAHDRADVRRRGGRDADPG